MKSLKNIVKKLIEIMTRPQKLLGVMILICGFIAAALELLGVSAIVPLVNAFTEPDKLWEKSYMVKAAGLFGIETNDGLIQMIIVGIIILYLVKNAFFIFYTWLKYKYSCKLKREIGLYMMEAYMNRGYVYFLNHNVNELLQGVNGDVGSLYNIVISLLQLVVQALTVIMIFVYMCVTDFTLSVGVLCAGLICMLIVLVGLKRPIRLAGVRYRQYSIRANQSLLQAFHGIKEVILMRKQKFFLKEYEDNTIQMNRNHIVQAVGVEAPAYIIEGVCITGIMLVLMVRLLSGGDALSFISTLAAFAVGAFRILPALGKISSVFGTLYANTPGFEAIYENLISAREFNDSYNQVGIEDAKEYADMSFQNALEGRNIFFSYAEELGYVLSDLSLTIPCGKAVALVGESGAGKSTLADILLGILPPTKGGVYLDDVNIREIPNLWARKVGYVPQSIFLYDTTIRENVAFGVSRNEIDDEVVIRALKDADLWDFIQSLPDGIQTVVGDRGVRLSGGQRQRIGIARALYHEPEILILDEATSALDNETEQSVMEAIDSLHGRMTMLIIAHRLTTVKKCDYIYEVAKGNVTRRTYEELI